ncbi:LacI family DNA-binding transcriptional regulator, partial [Rhizobiaceae sp. 2RAB30]
MIDVAQAAGVSIATVSAFINGTSKVSSELAERIQAAIGETGYKRNAIARSLKLGTTHTVGLTVPHITNPFFTEVVSVIQQAFDRAGYAVMLFCTDEHLDNQDDHIRLLLDRMVDGLIVARVGDGDRFKQLIDGARVPVVLFDRLCPDIEADTVTLDNRQAVIEAMNYLIGLGHRRIGYVSGGVDISPIRDRGEGYRQALAAAGLPFRPEFI